MAMSSFIQEQVDALCLPVSVNWLTDTDLEHLWDILGDIPLNYSEDGSTLLPIESYPDAATEPCLDEDFYLWPRGTPQQEIWHWFDKHYSRGLARLMNL